MPNLSEPEKPAVTLPGTVEKIIPASMKPIRAVPGEFPVEDAGRKMLLTSMDEAFSDYSQKAEQLSVLLAEARDPSSWTAARAVRR